MAEIDTNSVAETGTKTKSSNIPSFNWEVLKYVSWPIAAITLCLIFRSPIDDMLGRANKLSAFSVEIQLSKELQTLPLSQQQLDKLSGLTRDELDLFLLVSFKDIKTDEVSWPQDKYVAKMIRLRDAGLITIENPDAPLNQKLIHRVTDTGYRVRELLIDSTNSMLEKATKNSARACQQ